MSETPHRWSWGDWLWATVLAVVLITIALRWGLP
jgi:hypothetical protein